jgi:ribonuclease P protein component
MGKVETLKKDQQFKAIFEHGKSLSDKNLVLYFYQNQANQQPKLGLVISKKFGNAVRRNCLRRVLKEVFRLNHSKLYENYDLLIMPRYSLEEINYANLEKSFLKLCTKAGLVKEVES